MLLLLSLIARLPVDRVEAGYCKFSRIALQLGHVSRTWWRAEPILVLLEGLVH